MGDPRAKILVKLSLDVLFLLIVLSVYFIDVFRYMDDYYIGTVAILQETPYSPSQDKSTPLVEVIVASYSDFDSHFCSSPTPQVCNKRKDFEVSGILYLIFTCITHCLLIYGILGLMGMACGCSCCGFLKMTFVHYLYPVTYAISLVLYITVSGVFTLDIPANFSDNYKMKPEAGLLLMFGAQLIALISLVYFFFTRNQMNSLILVTHEGYTPFKA